MKIAVAGGTGTVGAHVVDALNAAGHEPVVLTRSTGVDLVTGEGLEGALAGVDALVDVTGPASTGTAASTAFFGTVTRNLLAAEQRADVAHHVALSIVGAAEVNAGYYAGKRIQEDLVTASGDNWTILRATQFHEFAPLLVRTASVGAFALVPRMECQPIAASEVGVELARIAVGEPGGILADLGGPRVENMADMVRRYLRKTGSSKRVLQLSLPGRWWHSLRDGTLIPGPGAQFGVETYEEWLRDQ
jgi:uncharacterized protein YbjT (DUF2867 family)